MKLKLELAKDILYMVLYFSKVFTAEIMADSLFKYLNASSEIILESGKM